MKKMILFSWKSLSRSSVHQEAEDEGEHKRLEHYSTNNEGTCLRLTVWRKSLILSCKGFTVINSNGDLVYRVENYVGHHHELVLMDGSGQSILTMTRRKMLGLAESWLIYDGEVDHYSTRRSTRSPLWSVKKHINFLRARQHHDVLAYVFRGRISNERRHSYVVEGSYIRRSCKVLDESRRVVAEVKRKEAMVCGVSFGVEVFLLVVHPGFDTAIAMALVLLLDQMFS